MRALQRMFSLLYRYVTSASGVYLASSVLAKAGAIFLIPLYTRRLGVEEFGDYAFAQTMTAVGPVLLSLGTDAAFGVFYFLGDDIEESRRRSGGAARASILVTLTLGALAQIGILLFAHGTQGIGSMRMLTCILWAGIGALLGNSPVTYFRVRQLPLRAAGYQLFQFANAIGSAYVLVVVMNRGLNGAIEALTWSGVTTGVIGISFTLLVMPGKLTWPLFLETMKFSLPFVPHFGSMQITSNSDRWVMKGAARAFDLGAYSLSVTVTGPIGMVLSAWNEAEAPKMGEAVRAGGAAALRHRFKRILASYALVTLIPGLVLIACLPLLKIIVGGRFHHALWPVPFFVLLMVVETPFSPCICVFSYLQRTRIIPVITMGCALLHLGANLSFIPAWGAAGALGARGLTAAVRSSVMVWFAYQTMRHRDSPP